MNRLDFTVDELRNILRSSPLASTWSGEGTSYLYIRFGNEEAPKITTRLMTTVEDHDLVLDLDDAGKVYGLELH